MLKLVLVRVLKSVSITLWHSSTRHLPVSIIQNGNIIQVYIYLNLTMMNHTSDNFKSMYLWNIKRVMQIITVVSKMHKRVVHIRTVLEYRWKNNKHNQRSQLQASWVQFWYNTFLAACSSNPDVYSSVGPQRFCSFCEWVCWSMVWNNCWFSLKIEVL